MSPSSFRNMDRGGTQSGWVLCAMRRKPRVTTAARVAVRSAVAASCSYGAWRAGALEEFTQLPGFGH